MNKQNTLEINENVLEHPIKNIIDKWYIMPLDDIKKTLGLDDLPKFMRIFGLVGFCASICYLLMCPLCCPERWVIAVFQIVLFGAIYYIGDKNVLSR